MRVLVVVAHPCGESFNQAIATRACAGLVDGGHSVDRLDLYADGIDPVMPEAEWRHYVDGAGSDAAAAHASLEPWVGAHIDRIHAADALVLVYPTWWSSLPAVLKGWLERCMRPGVAFRLDDRGRMRPGLSNLRRIVGISTYGSSWWYVKAVNDNGRRIVTRALRASAGPRSRATWLPFYSVDTSTADRRNAFLDRVHRSMRSLR